jgi:hypothetical protein
VVPIPYTYPPAAPSISGDVETINRFLQSPTLVARRLRTILEQRFIGDILLQGRATPAGGAIAYETSESIYTDRAIEAVSPGGEYPLTPVSTGAASIAKITKYGQDALVTDEAISRLAFGPVDRALLKLANTVVKAADATVLSLIASAVTATSAAAVAWSTAGAPGVSGSSFILRDVLKAKATILALNQGYSPDTLVVDDTTYAYVASDPTVVQAAQRESTDTPVYSGSFPMIGGLRVLPTPNLPAAGAWVIDSTMLGGIAFEALGGGYVSAGMGVETKSMREDENDQFRLRARRVFVPYVQEPGAAVKITGI